MKSMVSLLVGCVMLFSSGCAKAGFFDNSLIGKKAPDFKLMQCKGGEASLETLSKGGRAVLFFWATWCPHCREQLKSMNEQKAALEKLGAVVILIDIGEDKATVEKFLAAKGYDFNVLLDVDSAAAEMYQVAGVPTIVFIGPDGNIRESMYGFPEDYAEILK